MKIVGREKFDRQIAALPREIREAVRKALEVSATETVDVMRRFAPVDTGRLKASIDFTFGAAPSRSISSAPKQTGAAAAARAAKGDAGLAVTMYAGGTEAYYAGFQEFGTGEAPAQPFFFPGYRLGRKRAKARLARAIGAGARKAFRK